MPPLVFKTTGRLKKIVSRTPTEQRSLSTEPSNISFRTDQSDGQYSSAQAYVPERGADTIGAPSFSASKTSGGDPRSSDQDTSNLSREEWRRWALDDSTQGAGWMRVRGDGFAGKLARWTCSLPSQQVKLLFHVEFNEETGKYEHSKELEAQIKKVELERAAQRRKQAEETFSRVADKRTQLGMAGVTVEGLNGHIVPQTNLEKMILCGEIPAPGPINTAITQRSRPPSGDLAPNKLNHALEKLLLNETRHSTISGMLPLKTPIGSKLTFEYIGPDPHDEHVFYFRQKNRPTPSRLAEQIWQLRCKRERVWQSAAPRAYGPARDWGGAWGGGLLKFTNKFEAEGPTQVEVAGGSFRDVDLFSLTCVDEEFEGYDDEQWCPEVLPVVSAAKQSSLGSTKSQIYSDDERLYAMRSAQKVQVPRSVTRGKKSPVSFVSMAPMNAGFPERGYPGWSDREVVREGTAAPGMTRERVLEMQGMQGYQHQQQQQVSFQDHVDDGLGAGGVMPSPASTLNHARTAKSAVSAVSASSSLNSDGVALQRRMEGGRGVSGPRQLVVELKGRGGGIYPRAGGPNAHRSSLEAWRMPFTQAADFESETFDDTTWRFAAEANDQFNKALSNARVVPVYPVTHEGREPQSQQGFARLISNAPRVDAERKDSLLRYRR